MLHWHPDKFDGKVLGQVAEGDREAVREVREAVKRVVCILTNLNAKS